MASVFEKYQANAYPFRYAGSLLIHTICGGIPSDEKVAEGWLKARLAGSDAVLQQMVGQVVVERGLTDLDEAIKVVDDLKHLNGFKRDDNGLYIEGRQLKAAIKEAASVALNAGKIKPAHNKKGWGTTNKGFLNWLPEHVFVVEDKLHLGVNEPSGVLQRFVQTFRGSAIQYEEYVTDAKVNFTVISDHDFTEEQWAMLWLTGQMQGLGATRSQGFGRYEVVRWDQL